MRSDLVKKKAIKFHFTDADSYFMACICIHVDLKFQVNDIRNIYIFNHCLSHDTE